MLYRKSAVYRKAIELVRVAGGVAAELPRGQAFLGDQLRRSSSSVVLNYAEGCGKQSAAERKRYFRIARASVMETAAAMDVAVALGAGDKSPALALCDQISALLYRCR